MKPLIINRFFVYVLKFNLAIGICVLFLLKGDEFWLNQASFPTEVSSKNLDINNDDGVRVADLVSILSIFYRQLLCAQIPKAQKIQSCSKSFLRFWDLHL